MRSGFNPELERAHQEDTDHIYGGSSLICVALIPESDRKRYLPLGEVQRGRADFMDCASRGPLNVLEAKFTWLYQNGHLTLEERAWLEKKGYVQDGQITFSDRYIAVLSGTTAQGNSMKAPIDTIHRKGLIPKVMLPASPDMDFNDYIDPSKVTPAMEELGAQFLSRWSIFYDKVFLKDFPSVIAQDFINVAGHAWPTPKKGVYPKTSEPPNHVFVYFSTPRYEIYDSYLDDGKEGDFIKRLASDYALTEYGYRLYIRPNKVAAPRSFVDQLVSALFRGNLAEVWRLIALRNK